MENPDGHQAANKGVSADVVNQNGANQQISNERINSATARVNREERLKILKERQNEERLRKLEELNQHALQAAKIREEQDARRRKHFEEFGKKEEERRKQAEERRRLADEERKVSLQSKWESKKLSLARQPERSKPIFAFGSCTPRLVDNLTDGCLWKSQYNLNTAKEPPHQKSTTSAQDLHSQIKMSTSMYEWNQQKTTIDTHLPPGVLRPYRKSRTMELDPDRVFCGRKRTDLTPTIPIRREDGSTSRSTSRAGTNSGPRSGNATPSSRPPSSMSSLMTSSAHSQVQMRPRNLATRKSRPISVHVTGVNAADMIPPSTKVEREKLPTSSTTTPSPILMKTSTSGTVKAEKKNDIPTPPSSSGRTLPRKKVEGDSKNKSSSPDTTKIKGSESNSTKKSEKPQIDSSTIRRVPKSAPSKKKEMIEKPVDKEAEIGDVTLAPEAVKENVISGIENASMSNSEVIKESTPPLSTPPSTTQDEKIEIPKDQSLVSQEVEIETFESKPEVLSFVEIKPPVAVVENGTKASEEATEEKPALKQEEEKVTNVVVSPEQNGAILNGTVDNHNDTFGVSSNNPFVEDLIMDGANNVDGKQPKLMTEEDAKAALADKRRLAREAQEREAARIEEEARLEEERQRLEAEEADRLALIARQMEEERLRVAIEEQKQREVEEKKKREEEELAKQEREKEEREAAREAERIRQEMEERLKKEEEERLERKRRVEAIMSRTRKAGGDSAKATTPVPEENPNSGSDGKFSVNGIQHAMDQNSSTPTTVVNLNNYNNNNDFSNTLIDFGDMSSSSSPTPPPSTTQSNNATNLMNSSLQDLLS